MIALVSKKVPLVTRTGEDAGEGEVTYYRENGRCILVLRVGATEFSGSGSDYFDAFCDARVELEAADVLVATYGGSRAVWPSSMGRDMGAGLKAYRMVLGAPAVDLVGIFETGPGVEPATVEEQRAFFEKWILSLRDPSGTRAG